MSVRRDRGLVEVDEDLAEHVPAAVPTFQTLPYHPIRTAMRHEIGRKLVGATLSTTGKLLPGLLVAGGAAWAASRILGGIRAGVAAWRDRGKGDTTIEVKVVDVVRRVERLGNATPPPPVPRAQPTEVASRPSTRLARRARLLRGRGVA